MAEMTVDVWLYGALARYGGPEATSSFAHLQVRLPEGSTLGDLLARLRLPAAERGITFINGQLSALPGLQPDLDHPLSDSLRVGLFDLKSMWPFQYRHGAMMTQELFRALGEQELRHSYA
jgi:hypothetical protein